MKKKIIGFVAGLLLLVGLRYLPFREWMAPVFELLESSGGWGIAGFVALGTFGTLAFVPVSVWVFSSGMLFGFWVGFGTASLILVLGAHLGFLAGRWLWPKIGHLSLFQGKRFRALRQALEEEGYPLISWLRMTPVFHYMTGNLFFGSLSLKGGPYLVYSYLGMIPGTLLVVYAGSIAGSALGESDEISRIEIGLFLFGVGVLIWAGRRISKRLRLILHETEESRTSRAR